jgi:very-short-patch-repair endonuclease
MYGRDGKNAPMYGKRGVDCPSYGKHRTLEFKKMMSKRMSGKNHPMYGIHRYGKDAPMYGIHRYGKDAPFYGKHHTLEFRKALVRRNKKHWQNPEFVKKVLPKILSSNAVRPNNKEKELRYLLNFFVPLEFKYVGDGSVILDGKNPDFMNVNGKKQVIELAGTHWHDRGYARRRRRFFKKIGYRCLVIWDKELKRPERLGWKILEWMDK